MDIGLMLAAVTEEPSMGMWLVWKILPWLGVGAGLTFVIFVHELGHFLVAKACGVKCEKFYVGFDFFEFPIPFTRWKLPRSLFKFQWGETEYGIGSLPLGGYVKMLGQDDDPRNAEKEAERIRHGEHSEAAVVDPAHHPAVPAKTDHGDTILLDPRSYPAKTVPARMAIISAGVIMNLIFAVILAAVAFRLGVREAPATIGAAAPGSPAWSAGIVPGSKILQMGRRGSPHEFLRFEDLMTSVVLNGYDRKLPILMRRPDGQEVWYEIQPSDQLKSVTKRPTVGVTHAESRDVRIHPEVAAYLNPKSTPALEDRDKVTKVDGQALAADWELSAALAQKPLGPMTLTVERKAPGQAGSKDASPPQVLDVILEPRPMREIGAVMKIGPVVAVRKASPAEEAGFQAGDVILKVNGEPVGDPLSLPQRVVALGTSKPIEFVVSRQDRQGNEAERTLTVQPELPLQFNSQFLAGGPTAIEAIGVAYSVTRTVAAVLPGSPAEKAGLISGDFITQAQFIPAGEKQKQTEADILSSETLKPFALDDQLKSWTFVFTRLQLSLPDTQLTLKWKRGDNTHTATLAVQDSSTFFDESRGLDRYGSTEIHQAASLGQALALGFREASERVKEVVLILHSLVTGRVSATNLSGPAGIIYHAGGFASQGVSSLLIFLTILSANLAVLNFLPIPALDGGHMLFLAAEGIRGKPVDERLQIRLTVLGVICLLSLMVFATAMDIGRFAEMIQEWFS